MGGFSDVNYLSNNAPPAASEWQSLLRPLRGREPEGIWNLLAIVREMFRRNDRNAIPLLEILTEEVLACDLVCVILAKTIFNLMYEIVLEICSSLNGVFVIINDN